MKRIIWILGTIGLLTVLSGPAWAGGKKTCFTTTLDPVSIPPTGVTFTDGQKMYIMGSESAYMETASDPRVSCRSVTQRL
ncbi:MAG: hypothetical protein AAB676_09100 [Verrucomicrobiota bacterium]